MPRLAFRFSRPTLAILAVAGGCATLPAPQAPQSRDMAARFRQVLDSVESASSLEADEVATAPRIRLVVPPSSLAMGRYVESSFHLSSDAYVLVVAVDLDRRVRVLYPESPDQSGFAAKRASNRLARFFAGFGTASGHGVGYRLSRYDVTQRISPFGGGGVLLAVASDRPLQFERLLAPDGDWDEQALSRLVFDQTLPGAAHALGRATVLTGQDYNTDYTTFTGDRSLGAFAFAANRFDACDASFIHGSSLASAGYGWDYGPSSGVMTRFVGLFRRDGQTFARYAQGGCGGTRYYDVPVSGAPRPVPVPPDSTAPDTSTTRQPVHPGAPRFPIVTAESPGTPATTGREVHVRLEPQSTDRGRERPVTAAGLRFRTPGELSDAAERPDDIRFAPRDARIGRAPVRDVELQQMPERTVEPRVERAREAQPVREAPVRAEPVREAPVRAEPVRAEPVRAEPVREAPASREVHREPVHREPVERAPTPSAPATP
jgi:hypothetical protein